MIHTLSQLQLERVQQPERRGHVLSLIHSLHKPLDASAESPGGIAAVFVLICAKGPSLSPLSPFSPIPESLTYVFSMR